MAGDWNGDGIDSVGIYRNGIFYLRNTNSTGFADIVVLDRNLNIKAEGENEHHKIESIFKALARSISAISSGPWAERKRARRSRL